MSGRTRIERCRPALQSRTPPAAPAQTPPRLRPRPAKAEHGSGHTPATNNRGSGHTPATNNRGSGHARRKQSTAPATPGESRARLRPHPGNQQPRLRPHPGNQQPRLRPRPAKATRTSDRTRTCNLRGRSSLLYPVELRRQIKRTPGAATPVHSLPDHRIGPTVRFGVGMVGVAQLVRAPGCGPGGRGFESPRSPVESPPAIPRTSSSIGRATDS